MTSKNKTMNDGTKGVNFIKKVHLPICVDLDGTLVKTDTLFELFLRLIKHSPFSLFYLFYLLLKCIFDKKNGIILIKTFLTENFSKYVNNLPFNNELISYLKKQKQSGREIFLVTASLETFAKEIVDSLNLFDDVFGSNSQINLKGKDKAKFLVDKFGENSFVYIGNDCSDLSVWKHCGEIVCVDTKKSVKNQVASENPSKKITYFDNNLHKAKIFFKTIRIHQWAKNILIFIPLILAHKFLDFDALKNCILSFISFSLLASATYILNDVLDIENDRAHSTKKNRPLASGNIDCFYAFAVMVIFSVISVIIGISISINVLAMLMVYTLLTLSYSFFIKKMIILDIIMLSGLYIFRLYFGAQVTDTSISFYLVSFSIFIFFSLGAMKRFIELKNKDSIESIFGRGYNKLDTDIIAISGISSGVMSVLTYVLYIDQSAATLYTNATILMIGSILIFYFIVKTWIMANRGKVHEDPIVYAIKTKENYVLLISFVVIFFLAKPIL